MPIRGWKELKSNRRDIAGEIIQYAVRKAARRKK